MQKMRFRWVCLGPRARELTALSQASSWVKSLLLNYMVGQRTSKVIGRKGSKSEGKSNRRLV